MAGYIGSKASVVSSGAERKKVFTITTTTTSLTGLNYTPNLVHVFHNGIRLVDGTDYTATNGTTITLTNAAQNGDEVVVVSYATFQTSDTVSASAGGTFSGDVLVGTTDTSLYNNTSGGGFHVAPNGFTEVAYESANAADPAFLVNNTGAGGDIIQLRKDGTVVGSIGTDGTYMSIGNGAAALAFQGANNRILPWNQSTNDVTDASLDIGNGSYRFRNAYLSGGVYLGGTGAANLLDDYEEGTFTPAFSASGYSFSYHTQVGSYVKVGKLVSVCIYLRHDGSPSGSGSVALAITGLPFGIANDGHHNYTSAAMIVEASGSLFSGVPFVRPNRNTTSANIADYAGGSSPNFYKSWTGITGSMEWEIQFNYFTNN